MFPDEVDDHDDDDDLTIHQAYDSSDGTDYRGSRKVTLGLLSGSVLPLWAALEKTVVACRVQMTKAEEALKASQATSLHDVIALEIRCRPVAVHTMPPTSLLPCMLMAGKGSHDVIAC